MLVRTIAAMADLMPTWGRRALTTGEIGFGRTMFGDEIEWARVRVLQAPHALGFGAMVPHGHTIVFARWRARCDFAKATIDEQGWFVHELTHVWQAAKGVVLASAKLRALGKRAYRYKPLPQKFAKYNIERQAEIARHLYLARNGYREPGMPSKTWLEDVWAQR